MIRDIDEGFRKVLLDEAERNLEAVKLITAPITTVSEQEFRNKFLPLLKNIGPNFDTKRWIEQVSHVNVSLRVLDVDGIELFLIPPLLAPQKTTRIDGPRIVDESVRVRALSLDSPIAATSYVARMLSRYSDRSHDSNDSAHEMSLALNSVFAYYDMPLLPGTPESAAQSATAPTVDAVSDIVDFDYDF